MTRIERLARGHARNLEWLKDARRTMRRYRTEGREYERERGRRIIADAFEHAREVRSELLALMRKK